MDSSVFVSGHDIDSQTEAVPEQLEDRHCWIFRRWNKGLSSEESTTGTARNDWEELREDKRSRARVLELDLGEASPIHGVQAGGCQCLQSVRNVGQNSPVQRNILIPKSYTTACAKDRHPEQTTICIDNISKSLLGH